MKYLKGGKTMAMPEKERFFDTNLSIKLKDKGSFPYSYKYKDKSKVYDKDIVLKLLGESLKDDLVDKEREGHQYILTDMSGELYEAYITTDNVLTAIRSLRKPKNKKEKV